MAARFGLIAIASLLLAACGGASDADNPIDSGEVIPQLPTQTVDTAAAEDFFGDLPDAATVPDDEMGDLYFKLLTRLTTKIKAIGDEQDADAAAGLIAYARSEVDTLKARSDALSENQRSALLQDSVATINYARSQYDRELGKIGPDDPEYLRDFAEQADISWPLLGD